MSDHTEAGRLDRRTAEQLLDGAGGHASLHALLSAAAAPGRPEELAAEDAAVAAFLAAPAPARTSRLAALRRFTTAKVIALIGGSILLTGGVAYATGHFPGQNPAPAPSPTHHRQGGGHDNTPATQYSPSPLPTSPTPAPSSSATATGEQQHGKTTAPGQQKNSPNPHSTSAPPRGPGNNNGVPPSTNPGKGLKPGSSTGGAGGPGGTTNKGAPAGQNSGRGAENGPARQPAPAPTP